MLQVTNKPRVAAYQIIFCTLVENCQAISASITERKKTSIEEREVASVLVLFTGGGGGI
jgi:hypothetical protein